MATDWIKRNIFTKNTMIGATVGVGIVVAAPLGLAALGFSAGGVVAGSAAAGIQSGIGSVAAGSTFATLQSAGAAGLAASTKAAMVVGPTAIGRGYDCVKNKLK